MPIETHWANTSQSILIEKFYDVWTWQQVTEACQSQIHPQMADLIHPVAMIQDMTGSHWTPAPGLVQDVKKVMETACPDNIVMLLVVSGDSSIDTLVVSAYQRFGKADCTYQACKTINQALRLATDHLNQKN